ncbi:MAG: methyltransferase domain-containing protein [Rhodobacteraceae bacterium]|nr:methyltransferase domain-containing protein [Paracoccaceae bacterium]
MENRDSAFVGTIPENYERHFVPIIFSQYAEILANSVGHVDGDVLELACGTGVVTRALAPLQASGRYVATDFNPPMLEIAKAKAHGEHLEFQVTDAMALPFEASRFSTVICQFGVMFFADKPKAYAEVARVLKPGGKYVFSVWDSLAHNHFARTIHEGIGALYPDDPPQFMKLPFGYFDLRQIVAELQGAGFGRVTIEAIPLTSHAASPREVALGFGMGGPLSNEVSARGTLSIEAVIDALEEVMKAAYGDGPCAAPMQAFHICAALPE